MKRWLAGLIVLAILIPVVIALRLIRKERRDKARVAGNQQALLAYSRAFKPGISRKQLEDSLKESGVKFSEVCCYQERSAFAAQVKVGEEDTPWYCSEWPAYVVFEFTGTQPADPLPKISDMDVLKTIHLASGGEGCL